MHNADETDAEGAADKQRDSAWLALPVVLLIAVMLARAVWGGQHRTHYLRNDAVAGAPDWTIYRRKGHD